MNKRIITSSILLFLLALGCVQAGNPIAATSFAGGDGSKGAPYQISNFEELLLFSETASGQFNYYELTAHINAARSRDVSGGYPQVAVFVGHLQGNNYDVDSLYLEHSFIEELNLDGLVNTLGSDAADVVNLGFTNIEVNGGSTATLIGGIAGTAEIGALIDGCYVTGTIEGKQNVGGISSKARADAVINNCYVRANVTKLNGVITVGNVAGIVGMCNGQYTLSNCYFSGTSRWPLSKDHAAIITSGCYYDAAGTYDEVEGSDDDTDDPSVATELTTAQMADKESFVDWDFDSVWEMSPLGYPVLIKSRVRVFTDEVYYVSNDGDDANEGTIDAPFETLTKAMSVINYGDTCYIRGGVYRETVNVTKGHVCITAYNGETVVVTGCDSVNNWEAVEGNLYKAYVSDSVTQFFTEGARANIATYPNIDADYHMMDKWQYSVTDNNGESSFVTFEGESFPADYWKGAHYVGKNSGIVSTFSNAFKAARGTISSSINDTIYLTSDNVKAKGSNVSTGGIGKGFIISHKNALDAANEWYYENDTLYYITDGTTPDALLCEARTRSYVFEMEEADNVSLLGIDIKAGSINMKEATNCIIDSCSVRYIAPFSAYGTTDWELETDGSRGVYISGSNNTITNSYFGASWTACVTLDGQNQTIDNCLLENGNWVGSRLALISVHGDSCVITNNTLRHSTRDGIEAGNGAWLLKIGTDLTIEHNLIYSTNTRHTDGGCFYANHQQSNIDLIANTVLTYNWLKVDSKKYGISNRSFTGTFYPDNYSSGYTAKYNVMIDSYAGIKSNAFDQPSSDNRFYNNTMKGLMYAGKGTGYESFEELSNNLSNVAVEPVAEYESNPILLRNNITYSTADDEFIVGDYWDFRTKTTSMAIDAAVVIDGVTPSTEPDAGCYEYGVPAWIAGCDFDTPTFDDEPNYATPLEVPVLTSAILSIDKQYVTVVWAADSSSIEAVAIERQEDDGQWMRVGTVASGIETYTDTYLLSDEKALYRLRYVNNDDISAPSNVVETILDVATNLDDNNSELTLSQCSIYPNPASHYFTVTTTETMSVSVIDLGGHTVIAPVTVHDTQLISVQALPSGLYFVKAGSEVIKLVIM